MRTAIFVYKKTNLTFSTHEDNLQLCGMNASTLSLSQGDNPPCSLLPGMYKIVSNGDIGVDGDHSVFDIVVTPSEKTNDPRLVPTLAAELFGPLDMTAVNAFFITPEAKQVANP